MIRASDILQIAKTGLARRIWKCPDCGEEIACSFEAQMFEMYTGAPHCSQCEALMLLVDN
ncbi:unnamed protein product [marine sediment metagenome]|uniref:Uncharacterized protein n=1 Tax=marine sediment metagenome TaxID=412755 RepID=X1FG34_9ZZZZ